MAVRKIAIAEPQEEAPRRERPQAAVDGHSPAPSPALELQSLIETSFVASDVAAPRHSARARMLFMLGTCGAFWAAVTFATLKALG